MKIVVLKFGGTSVGSIKKIKKVADIIEIYKRKNYNALKNLFDGHTKKLLKDFKQIAITGGSGHLGTCLIDRLLSQGYSVRAQYNSYRRNHSKRHMRNHVIFEGKLCVNT